MHWGEKWNSGGNLHGLLKFFMENKKSFSLYMFHGGSNWGFMAGANAEDEHQYQPDITSYEYGSPVDEQGRATPHYLAMRRQLAANLPAGETLPDIPAPIPAMRLPEIQMARWTSLWDHLPTPIKSEQVRTFESPWPESRHDALPNASHAIGRRPACSTALARLRAGIPRRQIHRRPQPLQRPGIARFARRRLCRAVLDILVEGMGHINFYSYMTADRKGITEQVTLNATPLTNWEILPFPLDEQWAMSLGKTAASDNRPGGVFKGDFTLDTVADTFLDMSKFQKGYVWVNGHNLGRYWNIGPQQRLYCPAPWLKKGRNAIVILDLHQVPPRTGLGYAFSH